jgi:hypothetical protein
MSSSASLEDKYPFLAIMHPAHIRYIRHPSLNTLRYFFKLLEEINPEDRVDLLGIAYWYSHPNMGYSQEGGRPAPPDNSDAEFDAFRLRCFKATRIVSEPLLVIGLVHCILDHLFHLGDLTTVEENKSKLVRLAETAQSEGGAPGAPEKPSAADMAWMVDHIERLPEQAERYHSLYTYFCENVVSRLPMEWENEDEPEA